MNWSKTFQVLFVVLMLVVMALSLAPIDHPEFSPNDKVNHLIAYSMLTLCGISGFRKWLLMAMIVFCWGVLIEFLQGMTTYRVLSWYDVLANGTGVILGCLLAWLVGQLFARTQSSAGAGN
ncbi:MAG: VanZ family protein [Reinekea sp.]